LPTSTSVSLRWPATTDRRRRRYLGDEAGRAYVESAPVADDTAVRLEPVRWLTADYAKLDPG
jgi:hypothetical protein